MENTSNNYPLREIKEL